MKNICEKYLAEIARILLSKVNTVYVFFVNEKWAFLITFCPLSVCLSVNFHIFIFFSRTTGLISIKLGTKHP